MRKLTLKYVDIVEKNKLKLVSEEFPAIEDLIIDLINKDVFGIHAFFLKLITQSIINNLTDGFELDKDIIDEKNILFDDSLDKLIEFIGTQIDILNDKMNLLK